MISYDDIEVSSYTDKFEYYLSYEKTGDFEVSKECFLELIDSLKSHFEVSVMCSDKDPYCYYHYIWSLRSDFVYIGYARLRDEFID